MAETGTKSANEREEAGPEERRFAGPLAVQLGSRARPERLVKVSSSPAPRATDPPRILPRYAAISVTAARKKTRVKRRGYGPDGARENSWTRNGVHLSDIESIL